MSERSFPEAVDGLPAPRETEALLGAAGCDPDTATFVARQLRRNGWYLVNPDELNRDDIRRFETTLQGGQSVLEDANGFMIRAIRALLRMGEPSPVVTYREAAKAMLDGRDPFHD